MRRISFTIPLVLIWLIAAPRFAAAGEATQFTSKDGRVQIQMPGDYAEKTPPKPVIKIEAVDEPAGATIMVISESQREFASLAEYAGIVRDQMSSRLKDPQSDAGEKLQAGGHPAIRYEITGISANGMRMGFLVTIVQTETAFNQVIGSCLRANLAEHRDEFQKTADTLKELPLKTEKTDKHG